MGISDYNMIREAMNDAAFAGRPNLNVFQHRSKDIIARGIVIKKLKYVVYTSVAISPIVLRCSSTNIRFCERCEK